MNGRPGGRASGRWVGGNDVPAGSPDGTIMEQSERTFLAQTLRTADEFSVNPPWRDLHVAPVGPGVRQRTGPWPKATGRERGRPRRRAREGTGGPGGRGRPEVAARRSAPGTGAGAAWVCGSLGGVRAAQGRDPGRIGPRHERCARFGMRRSHPPRRCRRGEDSSPSPRATCYGWGADKARSATACGAVRGMREIPCACSISQTCTLAGNRPVGP